MQLLAQLDSAFGAAHSKGMLLVSMNDMLGAVGVNFIALSTRAEVRPSEDKLLRLFPGEAQARKTPLEERLYVVEATELPQEHTQVAQSGPLGSAHVPHPQAAGADPVMAGCMAAHVAELVFGTPLDWGCSHCLALK